MNWPTVKHWITIAASAGLGAAFAYVQSHPIDGTNWKAIVAGAAGAAAIAIVHLYQPSPNAPVVVASGSDKSAS